MSIKTVYTWFVKDYYPKNTVDATLGLIFYPLFPCLFITIIGILIKNAFLKYFIGVWVIYLVVLFILYVCNTLYSYTKHLVNEYRTWRARQAAAEIIRK